MAKYDPQAVMDARRKMLRERTPILQGQLAADPANCDLMMELTMCMARSGDYRGRNGTAELLRLLEMVLAKQPGNVDAIYLTAAVHLENEQYVAARDFLLARAPADARRERAIIICGYPYSPSLTPAIEWFRHI